MRRCQSLWAARLLALAALGLVGGCQLPPVNQPPLPGTAKPESVDVNPAVAPSVKPAREPRNAPGTLVPLTAGPGWIARGTAPTTPERREPDLPPPTSVAPRSLLDAVRGPRADSEPAWVPSVVVRKGSEAGFISAPIVVVAKEEPPKPPVVIQETSEPPAVAKPAPPELDTAPKLARAPELLPIPLRPTTPAPRPVADDSLVLVGGVPIPLPPTIPNSGGLPPPGSPPPLTSGGLTSPGSPGSSPPALWPKPPTVPLPGIPVAPAPIAPPVPSSKPAPADSLTRMVDGRPCATCGTYPISDCAGRFIGVVYDSFGRTDPAHKPHWEPITAAAFFTDAPRPVTQTRLRWDYSNHLTYPDRGEFFWARADGRGRGPSPAFGGVPYVDSHDLYLDQEIVFGRTSVAISVPYRSVDAYPFAASGAGFGDIQITAKGLLFDGELFMLAAQLRAYTPTGNFNKGLGTGHLSLEPGLIAGLRIGADTYAVAQLQEWVPIGGDHDYAGSVLRYGLSLNHVMWRPTKDVQMIGTWETTGFAFQDGAYTDPISGLPQKLSGQAAVNTGPGMRFFCGDTVDFGAGWSHAISGKYLVRDQLRFEFRCRY